jgi:UDP-N-acetylmuramyl pentapeptide phosphotransferase/UDP-N-acetylglucosamine-1-phosphate transferase
MAADGFLLAALVSLTTALLLLGTRRFHGHLTDDPPCGIQKLHRRPVPRVGGVALLAGLAAGAPLAGPEGVRLAAVLVLAALPAFAAGLAEDLTKRVPVALRLAATLGAGLLFVTLTGLPLTRTGLPGIDLLLQLAPVSLALTVVAVGGMANAVNLIDGVNGLALGVTLIVLGAVALIAAQAGDRALAGLCLVTAGAAAGVFIVNFPAGRLFLGDGGAYLAGVLLAALVLLLAARNPGVSPMTGLLLLAYPVAETLSSIQRRAARGRSHPGRADRLHLHSLTYRGPARRLARRLGRPGWANPLTGALLWAFPLASSVLAVSLPGATGTLTLAAALLALTYRWFYRRLALLDRPPPRAARPAIRAATPRSAPAAAVRSIAAQHLPQPENPRAMAMAAAQH